MLRTTTRVSNLVAFSVVLALTCAAVARADDARSAKGADLFTASPAVPLGDAQRADLARKRALSDAPLPAIAPPPEMLRPGMPKMLPLLPASRPPGWPTISPALGRVPREQWLRKAAHKPDDVTVTGPRAVGAGNGGGR